MGGGSSAGRRVALADAGSAADHRAHRRLSTLVAAVPDDRSRLVHPDHPHLPNLRLLGIPRQAAYPAGGGCPVKPDARRSGRSRAIRIAVNVLLVPLWALVGFICINSFEMYTEVGNLTL